jgi:plastocyanin
MAFWKGFAFHGPRLSRASRRAALIAGAVSLIILSGLISVIPLAKASSNSGSQAVVVTIPGGSGNPSGAPGYLQDNITVVIGVNNTVTWMNNDTVAGQGTSHTVTPKTQPAGGNWPTAGSGNIPPNQTYSFTFTVPGTYNYYCTYHAWMTGTVVVEAAATSTATNTTPEFPAASLAVILFAVIAAVILAVSRLRPARNVMSGSVTIRNRIVPSAPS